MDLCDRFCILPTPSDGHCFLHAVIGSWQQQFPNIPSPTLESIKCDIFSESMTKRDNYLAFITDYSNLGFVKLVKNYILHKKYNNVYGDIVPTITANALEIAIEICDIQPNGSVQYVLIHPESASRGMTVSIHRKNDHFSALKQGSIHHAVTHPHRLQPWPVGVDQSSLRVSSQRILSDSIGAHRLQSWPMCPDGSYAPNSTGANQGLTHYWITQSAAINQSISTTLEPTTSIPSLPPPSSSPTNYITMPGVDSSRAHRLQPWPMSSDVHPNSLSTHRLQSWPVSTVGLQTKCTDSTQRITYDRESLLALRSTAGRIERHVRKCLFQNHLWRPSIDYSADKNGGVQHNLLRSLPKQMHKDQRPQHLHLAMVNVGSIRNKVDDVLQHITTADYDVCFITETWLSTTAPADSAIIANLNNDRFKFQHISRGKSTRGGGIGILSKASLKVEILKKHIYKTFEMCLAKLQSKRCSLLVMTIYRPPYSLKNRNTVTKFLTEFSDICSDILSIYTDKSLIIVGDFNIHLNNINDSDTKSFQSLLDSFMWCQHVKDMTHISGNLIDFCITSSNSILQISQPLVDYFISDHAFISFHVNIPRPSIQKKLVSYRAIKKIDKITFGHDLHNLVQSLSSSSVTNNLSVQELASQYDATLLKLLDKHAPLKSKVISPRVPVAWFDDSCKQLKAAVRKQEKIWRKSKEPDDLSHFKALRRRYRRFLQESKTRHFQTAISEAKGNSRRLFSITNGLMGKNKKPDLPVTSCEKFLAEEFAHHFINKIDIIRDDLAQHSRYQPSHTATTALSFFKPLPSEVICKIIKDSKSTTCLSDPIPTEIIKDHHITLVPLISTIVNQSLQSGIFPDHWKKAIVTPLLKKQDLDRSLSNYRPVSNLCFISKITEKCIIRQLNQYLSDNSLHAGHQSAYKESFSTETALCALMDHLLWAFERGQASIIVSLDLSAAFDTVDHQILLDLLHKKYGLEGCSLDWMASYLCNRQFQVQIGKYLSDLRIFNYSVPQGSCLGPILFNLYSSTITECIDSQQSLGAYADDHCLRDSFSPIDSIDERNCIDRMQASLNNISSWMASNMLKMNPDKTEATIFASKRLRDKVSTSSIEVANELVPISDGLKYLGVWFDSCLTMEKHITTKCRAAAHNIRIIASIRRHIDLETAKLLAVSLVLTHLDYSNSILYGLPNKSLVQLQRIQNWAAKVVLQQGKFTSSKHALRSLHWLPVKQRIDFKLLCLVYKCLHDMAPHYLSSLIRLKQFTRSTRASTQHSLTLDVPRYTKSTFACRAFSIQGPILWNDLPSDIKGSSSFYTFKKRIKTLLFRRAFDSADDPDSF